MFAVIFICILRKGIWKHRKKLEPAKISCHTVFSTFYKNFLPLAFFNVQFVATFHAGVASQYKG